MRLFVIIIIIIIVIKVDIRMFLERENNSGKFQNNAINDVKQILVSHVIRSEIWGRSLKDIKVTFILLEIPIH